MQVWSILYSFFACWIYLHVTVVVVMLFISLFGSWRESRSSFCIVCFLWLYNFFSSKAQLDWLWNPLNPLKTWKKEWNLPVMRSEAFALVTDPLCFIVSDLPLAWLRRICNFLTISAARPQSRQFFLQSVSVDFYLGTAICFLLIIFQFFFVEQCPPLDCAFQGLEGVAF
jgi:hypothetical protein